MIISSLHYAHVMSPTVNNVDSVTAQIVLYSEYQKIKKDKKNYQQQ